MGSAEIVEQLEEGGRLIRFDYEGIFLETLERLGKMPLAPRGFGTARRRTRQTVSWREKRWLIAEN